MNSLIAVILSPNNLPFVAAMFFLAFMEMRGINSGKDVHNENIIVGLGLLGTFWGIFVGLQGFDPDKIQDSIPVLLEGMKTAFLTSIFGMGISLGLNYYKKTKLSDIPTDDTDLLHGILTNSTEQTVLLRKLSDSIEDNSRKSVGSIDQRLGEISVLLKTAMESLSKGATEEIIKALENVIRDFNNNLTEQFGDNFKQLNEAVLRLVQWQDKYKEQLLEMTKTLDSAIHGMEGATIAYHHISEKSQTILDTFRSTEMRIQEFAMNSERFVKSSERLDSVTNSVNANYLEIGKNLEQVGNKIGTSLSQQSESLAMLTEELKKQLPDSLKQLNLTLAALTNQFRSDYEFFLTKVRELTVAGVRK